MRRFVQTALALGLAVGMTGCATPYMIDRGRDAGDIFTATIGKGSGVKARLGPMNASVFLGQGEMLGVRNGVLCRHQGEAETLSVELLLVGYEVASLGDDRGKNFLAMNALLFEDLATDAGEHPRFRDNFTTRWMSMFRTQLQLR